MSKLIDVRWKLLRTKESIRKRNRGLSKPSNQMPPALQTMAKAEQHALSLYEKWLIDAIGDLDNAISELQRLKKLV